MALSLTIVHNFAGLSSLLSTSPKTKLFYTMQQLAGYLLMSSSSMTVLAIQQRRQTASLWNAAVISVTMSFAAFLVIAISALISGYKLCKRIIW